MEDSVGLPLGRDERPMVLFNSSLEPEPNITSLQPQTRLMARSVYSPSETNKSDYVTLSSSEPYNEDGESCDEDEGEDEDGDVDETGQDAEFHSIQPRDLRSTNQPRRLPTTAKIAKAANALPGHLQNLSQAKGDQNQRSRLPPKSLNNRKQRTRRLFADYVGDWLCTANVGCNRKTKGFATRYSCVRHMSRKHNIKSEPLKRNSSKARKPNHTPAGTNHPSYFSK